MFTFSVLTDKITESKEMRYEHKKSCADIVAENIRRFRMERKLTQEELAERSGLSHQYISLIERKKQSASIKSLDKISNALAISCEFLFRDQTKKKTSLKHILPNELSAIIQYFPEKDLETVVEVLKLVARRFEFFKKK